MVSTHIFISVVILSVVDHKVWLELNNRSNCNSICSWHVTKHETQFHPVHVLLPSFENSSLMSSDSCLKVKHKSHCIWLFWNSSINILKWDHTPPARCCCPQKCENTVCCFHFMIFTPNCKCHLAWHLLLHSKSEWVLLQVVLWHSLRVSHTLEVWSVTFTPWTPYNSSPWPTFFTL